MASEILVKHGTAIVWADNTNYSSNISSLGQTDQINLTSIAAGAARQGAKGDLEYLATNKFPARWLVSVGIEFATTSAPTAGETVDIYWAGSPSATAGNANPGGTIGTDSAYTGTGANTIEESLKQLQFIGSLICTADVTPTVQYQTVGVLHTDHRYGMPVVFNNTATAALMGDAVEQYVALIPLIDESQ